jgi:chromosome segregation ATPase
MLRVTVSTLSLLMEIKSIEEEGITIFDGRESRRLRALPLAVESVMEVKQNLRKSRQLLRDWSMISRRLGGKITVAMGQLNQIKDSRDRLVEEGNTLSQKKDQSKDRTEKSEMDIQELETELTELRTKIESYAAEM